MSTFHYDPTVDAAYLTIEEETSLAGPTVEMSVYVDIDLESGKIVGIEFLDIEPIRQYLPALTSNIPESEEA